MWDMASKKHQFCHFTETEECYRDKNYKFRSFTYYYSRAGVSMVVHAKAYNLCLGGHLPRFTMKSNYRVFVFRPDGPTRIIPGLFRGS